MGIYVNHPDGKEVFLERIGARISVDDAKNIREFAEMLPVCLVNSGRFTAAAVAYCSREIDEFTVPADFRPKIWYLVDRKDIEPWLDKPIPEGY